jgi:HAD superfamily hydrolase (TIGR01509 family)
MQAVNDVTHIFFDLHGTLVDPIRTRQQYRTGLSIYLAQHYGGIPAQWCAADQQIVRDWDSYHADLNFSGDDGITDYYESLYRIARALFRIAGIAAPPKEKLLPLSRLLPVAASHAVNALYPEVEQVLRALIRRGYRLGTTAYILQAQIDAIVSACGIRDCFQAPLIGFDTFEHYERDQRYFERVALLCGVQPASCLVVDDGHGTLDAAAACGMVTVSLQRSPQSSSGQDHLILEGSLLPLVDLIEG